MKKDELISSIRSSINELERLDLVGKAIVGTYKE